MWKIMVIKVPSPCGDSDRCLTSQTSWSFELAGFKSNPPLIYPGGISAGLLLAPWQRTSSLWLGTSSSTAINHTAYLAEFLFQTLQNTLERQISQWFVGLGVFLVLPFSWHKEQLWWIHSFCHSGMGNEDTAGCASEKKKKGVVPKHQPHQTLSRCALSIPSPSLWHNFSCFPWGWSMTLSFVICFLCNDMTWLLWICWCKTDFPSLLGGQFVLSKKGIVFNVCSLFAIWKHCSN